MKRFIKNIALIASAALAMTGCVGEPEGVIDSIDLNRCLAPTNFEAEIVATVGTDVKLTWDAMQGTEYYTVEVYESTSTTIDEETGEEVAAAPDFDASEPFKTETQIKEIPFVVTGLEVDKSYFARVKGHATNKEDSKWTVLEEAFATSAVRTSFKVTVTERTKNSISVTWSEGEDPNDLTTLRATPVSDSSKKGVDLALTAEMIAARTATVAGLEPCTDYKLTLIYGKACNRGSITAFTRPTDEGFNTVNTVDAIVNAITGTIGDVKLKLQYNDGVAYDLPSTAAITCNLWLVGETTTDGKKPIVTGLDIQPGGAVTTIHLEDLVLDGAVYAVEGAETKGHILTAKAAMEAFELINCEVYGYTKGLYYNNVAGADCGSILIDGCYVHDVNADGSVGGDFIDVRNGVHPSIVVKNSTFYACARTFLRVSDSADSGTIEVKNNTFNFVTTTKTSSNNAGIFGVRTKATPESILCTKNVFLNEYSDGEKEGAEFVRLVRNSSDTNAPVCSGNYFYNVGAGWFVSAATTIAGAAFDQAAALADGGVLLEVDPCQSSGAGKLYLNETNDIAAKQAGDPRWWNAAIPEPPVRATELVAVSEPYTWDFTDKKIYDGEVLSATTIIGNARIYASAEAPSEIILGNGVYFAAAGMIDAAGEPTQGAVGILTNGYGAVVVTAEGAGGVEGVQVLAGGDRYTVLADGEPHKVLLGDLSGDNNIYVIAAGGVTLKQIEWTQDLTADATATALKAPAVSFDNRKVDEGTAMAVTASWAAVENADHYEVTWRGATTEQTACEYVIAAEEVAALGVGEYELSVVAVPVATSSKWLRSEAGVATLQINKVVVGGEVTLTWNFSDTIWETEVFDWLTPLGSDGSKDMDVTVDGLRVVAGGSNIRGYLNEEVGNYLQPNGGGSTTKRCFSFTAPANGTLRVKVSCTGTEDLSRVVKVQVGEDGAVMEQPGGHATPTWVEYDIEANNQTVYIYPSGGLRFYAIEYTYVSAPQEQTIEWGHAAFDDIWVNGCASDTGNIDATFVTTKMTAGGKLSVDADGFTYDGLQFLLGGGKFKFGQNNNSAGELTTRVQFGGTGNTGKAVLIFEAPAAGTLKLDVIASGDTTEKPRPICVAVDGTEIASLPTPDKTATPQIFEVDCTTAVAGSKIYIYSGNSGINLFSISYTYTK
ncbi:MAG: DUF4957 domain-containing protein [Tidjanibacter sp.]|nr:DUF4957 domain-containing protein [Tidjanibacter sp.]